MAWHRSASKYGAKKVTVDGFTFDSKKEARRYQELFLMELDGEITNLQMQVKYILIPSQYATTERYSKTGKRLKDGRVCIEKECAYIADFVYEQDGKLIVEDTKGFRTPEYIIKRKLMLYIHGIRIQEV